MTDARRHDAELRNRLRAADPARTVDGSASWIDNVVEEIVSVEVENRPASRRWVLTAAAAAVLAIAGIGGYAVLSGVAPRPTEKGSVVALMVPASDPAMSCMQFGVEALRPMEKAFDATVAEVSADKVTLNVTHWYKGGGDAEVVELTTEAAAGSLLEGGIVFKQGERYLVTATGDTVNTCGFSAPWSQEMADAFTNAF